jgi:colanic acid/amylovoran biosynthesis glycosyltransferase
VFVHTQLTAIRRYDVKFVTRQRESWSEELFPFPNVADYRSSDSGRSRLFADTSYRFARRLAKHEARWYERVIRDFEPTVVHAHFAVDAAYLSPVLDRLQSPTVVSCYGYDVSGFPLRYGGFGRRYVQRAFESADLVLAMSDDMRSDIVSLGCPPQKVIVHYHGINLSRFPFVDRSVRERPTVRLLFVGALIDKKGVLDVFQAFERLARDHQYLELRFVGRGPREATLRQRAEAAGLADRVTFAGYVPNTRLAGELVDADIFCHPSGADQQGNKEGIPGTIVEAAASGLPVVSTRHAGIPVVVQDGTTGILVAEHDVEALATAISRLVDHPEERHAMGRAGGMLARAVGDAQKQAARLEQIYDGLAERSATRSAQRPA